MENYQTQSGKTVFPINLTHFLSRSGVAARRRCADIIKAGQVEINGEIVTEPGRKVNESDQVTHNGKEIRIGERYYLMLNKPPGYTCTAVDPHAEHLALELINLPEARIFSIGRLDKESEGLLLFTNDGNYCEKLTHPSFEHPKTYEVTTDKPIPETMRKKMESGIIDTGEKLRAAKVEEISERLYRFVLTEGKKREIRRLIKFAGCHTVRLCRVAVGKLELGNLPSGKWRFLTGEEIAASLKNQRLPLD